MVIVDRNFLPRIDSTWSLDILVSLFDLNYDLYCFCLHTVVFSTSVVLSVMNLHFFRVVISDQNSLVNLIVSWYLYISIPNIIE